MDSLIGAGLESSYEKSIAKNREGKGGMGGARALLQQREE